MNLDEAKTLLGGEEENSQYLKDGKRWLDGILLLKKYDPDFGVGHQLYGEHDIIYVHPHIPEMTVDHLKQLSRWGFHLDSDSDGWAIFT